MGVQHPILVDDNGQETFVVVYFYCAEARLIVEVDKTVHANRQAEDRARDLATALRGYRVMRVKAEEVEGNLPELLARINREVERYVQAPGTYTHSKHPPLPPSS